MNAFEEWSRRVTDDMGRAVGVPPLAVGDPKVACIGECDYPKRNHSSGCRRNRQRYAIDVPRSQHFEWSADPDAGQVDTPVGPAEASNLAEVIGQTFEATRRRVTDRMVGATPAGYDAGGSFPELAVAAPAPPRAELLREAEQVVTGDRNNAYGPPTADFARTAAMLSAMGFRFHDRDVAPHQVAMILAVVKLSRLTWAPGKRDSWVDLAGYAACGWECADGEAET